MAGRLEEVPEVRRGGWRGIGVDSDRTKSEILKNDFIFILMKVVFFKTTGVQCKPSFQPFFQEIINKDPFLTDVLGLGWGCRSVLNYF